MRFSLIALSAILGLAYANYDYTCWDDKGNKDEYCKKMNKGEWSECKNFDQSVSTHRRVPSFRLN